MFASDQKRDKGRVEVEIYLDNGDQLLGNLRLNPAERVSDLMNDERQFLPLETASGRIIILRKAVIAKLVPLDQAVDDAKISDPYEILGVSRDTGEEEITRSYHALCAENHPDKVQASGLSPHFMEMATTRMVRINDAYRRVMSERRAANTNQKRSGTTG